MTKTIYIIYKHTNKVTNKSYIGQTKIGMLNRWKKHLYELSRNVTTCHFHNSIRKYGSDNWNHEILFTTSNPNIIDPAEIFLIAYFNTYDFGYNLTIGGKGKPRNKNPSTRKIINIVWKLNKNYLCLVLGIIWDN